MLLVKGCSLGGQGDNILGLLSGNRLWMTFLETRSRRTLKGKLITLASAPDGLPAKATSLSHGRRETSSACAFVKFGGLLALVVLRLSWEDVLVFRKDGTVLGF